MIGQTVAHYRITARLGEGGMGIVYEAEDLRLPRHVALKFLPAGRVQDHAARERFEREARAAAVLSHPHICVLHDVAEHEGQPFLVMERLQGSSLRDRLGAGPLPAEETLRIGAQVADALDAAHAAGIVHRDVKPANIFLTDRGDAKVLDFGVARLSPVKGADAASEVPTLEKLTTPGTAVGTVAYMSPEQVLGRPADARSDLFSLGVVLYEMATGARPFPGDSMGVVFDAILHKAPTSPVRLNPRIPVELERIVNRCLEKDAARRWASAADLRGALRRCLDDLQHSGSATALARRWARDRRVWASGLSLLAALAVGGFAYARHRAHVRWAREEALPEIRRLASSGLDGSRPAFLLAERALRYLPRDPELHQLRDSVSADCEVLTDPPGASVWIKPYEEPGSAWEHIGTTPIRGRRLPASYLRWRVEKPGFAPLTRVEWGARVDVIRGSAVPGRPSWRLDPEGSVAPDTVRVEGADGLPDFLVDRYEVTNRAYATFVQAGGYRDPRYWKHPFVRDGVTLPFAEATRLLVDRTGQPGPATWETGDYPDGQDDLPVTGVSWYEAAAYAEFAGKALPTLRHWFVATGYYLGRTRFTFGRLLITISNFGGKGPVPVGSTEALSPFGVADLAGNVREWCSNASERGHCLRGGAWNDQTYMYSYVTQASSFDRSERNGFRCAKYVGAGAIPADAFAPYRSDSVRDFHREKPVSDEIFAVYREQFSYDAHDLGARLEARDGGHPDWIRETVSFNAAYGGERVRAQLFLPRRVRPPFQVVLYFPGLTALQRNPSDLLEETIEFKQNLAFLPKSGRALLHPVYKGTYERGADSDLLSQPGTREAATWRIQLVQDARRSIDYLQSRPDIDGTRIGYYGFSWGGRMASIILAVEPRLKVAVVLSGGLQSAFRFRPEIDQINFVSRVRAPTLMLHGRYDLTVLLEAEARPMFELLGTPASDKRLYLADSDHWIPRNDLIRESLAWFDKYLGPAEPASTATTRD
jgi:dienelactone hydrolase